MWKRMVEMIEKNRVGERGEARRGRVKKREKREGRRKLDRRKER